MPISEPPEQSTPFFETPKASDVQFTVGSFSMTRFGTTKVKNIPAALRLV